MIRSCVRFGLLLTGHILASGASAQTLGQGQDDPVSLWRVLGVLVLCIGLAVGGAYALRSRMMASRLLTGLARRDSRLHLLDRLRLNQNVDLCLVRCDDQLLLLSTSAQGVQILPYTPTREITVPEVLA